MPLPPLSPITRIVAVPTASGTGVRPSFEKISGILAALIGAWIAVGAPGAALLPAGTDAAAIQAQLAAVTSWQGFVTVALPLIAIGASLWRQRERNARSGA